MHEIEEDPGTVYRGCVCFLIHRGDVCGDKVYSSPRFNASAMAPTGLSKLCPSCHDVHVGRSGSSPPCWSSHVVDGQWHTPPLQTLSLRKDNGGSALYLTCHKK